MHCPSAERWLRHPRPSLLLRGHPAACDSVGRDARAEAARLHLVGNDSRQRWARAGEHCGYGRRVCESEATQAGLPGSYLALLSVTDTSPTMRDGAASLRFDLTGPIWVRPDGVALANTSAEFMNFGWLAPINQTAAGSYQIPIFTPTWVGSTAPNVGVQVASRDCNSWSDPNGSGSYSYAANDLFDAYVWPTSVLCTSPSHVFCVQQ